MGCKYAEFDRYFGECLCQKDGRPCRVACKKCSFLDKQKSPTKCWGFLFLLRFLLRYRR